MFKAGRETGNNDNKWTTDNGARNTNWHNGSTAIFGGNSGRVTLAEVVNRGHGV